MCKIITNEVKTGTEVINGKSYDVLEVTQSCSSCGSTNININVSKSGKTTAVCHSCEVSYDNSNKALNARLETTGQRKYNVSLDGRSDVVEPESDEVYRDVDDGFKLLELTDLIESLPISDSNKYILRQLLTSKSYKDIANDLDIHVSNIYDRLKTVRRQLIDSGINVETFRDYLY